MDRLVNVAVKLERAGEHLDALERRVAAFLNADAYSTYIDETLNGGGIVRVRIKEEMPPAWSAIAGDIVHNLRSSLDVLLYQLVEAHTGEQPPTTTAFPICETPREYVRKADRSTKGVTAEARQAIDALRPYKSGNDDLHALHMLDIEDKHHLLLDIAVAARPMLQIGPSLPQPGGGSWTVMQPFSSVHLRQSSRFRDGTELMRADKDANSILPFLGFIFFPVLLSSVFEEPVEAIATLDRLGDATRAAVSTLLPFLNH
jgi:hypothetical protein